MIRHFLILTALSVPLASAATLLYDFETGPTYMDAATTVPGATATTLTWDPLYDSVAGDSVVAVRDDAVGSNVFLINSRASDIESILDATTSTHFAFSLTPDAGQALDFSAATARAQVFGYADVTGIYNIWYRMYAETSGDPGTWTQIGPRRSILMPGGNGSGTIINAGFTDMATSSAVAGYELTPGITGELTASRPFDFSALGVLAVDESVNFHFVVSDDRKNNENFYNAVDNIQIEGVAVVPEPFSALLSAGFLGLALLLRRR